MFDEEIFPAAEKILADIENVIKKDLKLLGFEVLPVVLNENKSPVVHSEHWLGLESWCVPHVYCHAYSRIMAARQNKRKREDDAQVNRLLMGVLMINPDITTLWNMRKEQIVNGRLDCDFELRLTALVLSRRPKCADIFAHRRWIIQRLLKEGSADSELLDSEMEVCELAADRYSNNYHAWTHRLWTLQRSLEQSEARSRLLEREWAWSHRWVSAHVSDHSGLHYRQRLLDLAAAAGDAAATPTAELHFVSELMRDFPGHEALWCHRRAVLARSRPDCVASCERSFLKTLAPENAAHAQRHVRWLSRVFKIQLSLDDSNLLK